MDRAIQEYLAALKADPASFCEGTDWPVLFFPGDYAQCPALADQAARGPGFTGRSLLTQMASILASVGQRGGAGELLDRAIDLDPTSADSLFYKGSVAPNLKQAARGGQAIRVRLSLAPQSASAIITWGGLLLDGRERRRARRV